jgi:hypothetical protein
MAGMVSSCRDLLQWQVETDATLQCRAPSKVVRVHALLFLGMAALLQHGDDVVQLDLNSNKSTRRT